MKDLFVKFLSTPTYDNFLKLRSELISADVFNPYSRELEDTSALIQSD